MDVHFACSLHPPLDVKHELIHSHAKPFPEKPPLHVQVWMPAPVASQRALAAHPPWSPKSLQLSMAEHERPPPVKPSLQRQRYG